VTEVQGTSGAHQRSCDRVTPARPVSLVAIGITLLAAIGCGLWAAIHVHPHALVYSGALFVHLASLVVGFGAVLSVDWVALLWLVGRRDLAEVLNAADNVQVPIWTGYTGLVASGIALEPDLSAPFTIVKLALVVVIGWNGLLVSWLAPRLRVGSQRALTLSGMSALVSQLGWWGATVIGYVNAG